MNIDIEEWKKLYSQKIVSWQNNTDKLKSLKSVDFIVLYAAVLEFKGLFLINNKKG
jgi:hypothetical protein